MKNFPAFLIKVIEGEEKGFCLGIFRVGLVFLSGIYFLLTKLRNFLYNLNLLKIKKLSVFTISVGNITVGGTGKTPMVSFLAEKFQGQGKKVAILSRGYKRDSSSGIEVVSDGLKIKSSVRQGGDEPYLLAKNLPGVAVIVGKNRFSSGNYAIRELKSEVLILDDGFQHRRIARNVDIVLVDSTNPFGNGQLIPRGRLREPPGELKRADILVLTRTDQAEDLETLRETLKKINSQALFLETVHRGEGWVDFKTRKKVGLEELSGKKALALSSIGRPQAFEETLKSLGVLVVEKARFLDHYWYKKEDLRSVEEKAQAKGAEFILTTQKDAVRIPGDYRAELKIYYLKIKLEITKGEAELKERLWR